MAQVNLSVLKITGDENNYLITDETARTNALSVANSKLLTVSLESEYTSGTKTLTLSLMSSKQ